MTINDAIQQTDTILEEYRYEVADDLMKSIRKKAVSSTTSMRIKWFNGRKTTSDFHVEVNRLYGSDNFYVARCKHGVVFDMGNRLVQVEDLSDLRDDILEMDQTILEHFNPSD